MKVIVSLLRGVTRASSQNQMEDLRTLYLSSDCATSILRPER